MFETDKLQLNEYKITFVKLYFCCKRKVPVSYFKFSNSSCYENSPQLIQLFTSFRLIAKSL